MNKGLFIWVSINILGLYIYFIITKIKQKKLGLDAVLIIIFIILLLKNLYPHFKNDKRKEYMYKISHVLPKEVSFYKVKKCDLTEKKDDKKILTINEEKEIELFLTNYFKKDLIYSNPTMKGILNYFIIEMEIDEKMINFCVEDGEEAYILIYLLGYKYNNSNTSISYKLKYFFKKLEGK